MRLSKPAHISTSSAPGLLIHWILQTCPPLILIVNTVLLHDQMDVIQRLTVNSVCECEDGVNSSALSHLPSEDFSAVKNSPLSLSVIWTLMTSCVLLCLPLCLDQLIPTCRGRSSIKDGFAPQLGAAFHLPNRLQHPAILIPCPAL